MAYGVTEGRLMLDRRVRNLLTGAEFQVPALAKPRITRFTLPFVNGGPIPGHPGGAKAGHWFRASTLCKGPRSGPFA